jgi:hypothetical protein
VLKDKREILLRLKAARKPQLNIGKTGAIAYVINKVV